MANFAKTKNVLKRVDELIKVGQKKEAIQALHGLITSKSFRAWEKPHEKIMFKYIDLCVDLKQSRSAKNGLIQYRNVCQEANVSSWEEVIKHFLHIATEKADQKARSHADEEALDVDDLEADLKFLWETYRAVLDILRTNNTKLEALYATTAHESLQFCKHYKRTREFSRLCEVIRNHVANPDLSSPENLQLYTDTRFDQLKVAIELGLWEEAFRSAKDIHGLMCMVKETNKSSMLMVYYSQLIEIFWISSRHLYHAYVLLKLFRLQEEDLNQKDLQLVASSVVLAALSIPPFDQAHSDNEKEGKLRMTRLIGYESRDMLSRSALVSELVSRGVLSCASQEVKDIYHALENECQTLDLGSKIQTLLGEISKSGEKLSSSASSLLPKMQLSQYVPCLEKFATLRLLQQLSKVYQTIRIKDLSKLVPFFEFSVVEKIAVDAVKNSFVDMKVDHMIDLVFFGTLGIESDGVKARLAEYLTKVSAMLTSVPSKASKLADTVEKEHVRLLARKSIIEKRKEDQERQQLEMEREEEKLQKLKEEAEERRLEAERRRKRTLKELKETQALLEETEIRMKKGEKKTLLDGLAKTMDYLERAKRKVAAPQLRDVELSKERHESDLKENQRLSRMLDGKEIFQLTQAMISRRQAEFVRILTDKE